MTRNHEYFAGSTVAQVAQDQVEDLLCKRQSKVRSGGDTRTWNLRQSNDLRSFGYSRFGSKSDTPCVVCFNRLRVVKEGTVLIVAEDDVFDPGDLLNVVGRSF